MPAARREHTRSPPPQYENIIGRKPKGTQQCAELSSATPALQRDLSTAVQCHVRTSGFQVGTCPPDSHGPKALPGTEKGRHRSRFAKGTGEENLVGCSVPGMHFAPNPRRIRRKSVNETVARLLLAGATFLMGASRTLEDPLVLSDMNAPKSRRIWSR